MSRARWIAALLVAIVCLPSLDAQAAKGKSLCKRLCRSTVQACIAESCAGLRRKPLKRCKRQCNRDTIAACRLDSDRSRCVPPPPPPAPRFATPLRSGPIALSATDGVLVNVNPDVDTITVYDVAGTPAKIAEWSVGRDPESVAVTPDGARAYVANAFDGTVSVMDLATGATAAVIAVGTEPMAIVSSPNGSRMYVANSASNDVSVIDTSTDTVVATVDVSVSGTAPRALGVTNDGDTDDTDERIFVPLFYGQLRPGKTAVQEGQDDQREGRVVWISAGTNAVGGSPNPVTLAPVASTGFNANGQLAPATAGPTPAVASVNPQAFTTATGCFPNQLAAVAIQPTTSHAYVVSTCASPNGPLRFNSMLQGVVSVFDTVTQTELTAPQTAAGVRTTAPLNLNQGVNLDTALQPRLFLTNPVAMAWRPDGSDAWVVVQNSDVVVRLTADAGGVPTIGAPLASGAGAIVRVDLQNVTGDRIPGKAPRGLVIDSTGVRAHVYNFISRSITTLDISNATAPSVVATVRASELPADGTVAATVHLGAELFFTGRGPDGRMSAESWGGCITCHPGGRSDNVTWMFDAGPRQTIALDGMFDKNDPSDQRVLNWSAVRDENHDFELNTRGIFGGRGLIDDDRLFFAIGGASGATPADSSLIEQFQQATFAVGTTNDLAGGAPLPNLAALTARRDFAVATLDDGRVFVLGGRSGAGQGTLVADTDAVLEFDPRTNTITPRSATGFTIRHSLGAAAVRTALGARIYAIGGYADTGAASLPVTTVEEYDPSTDTWRSVASLPTAVSQFGITVAGGVNTAEPAQLIHVVSGNTGSESVPSVANANPVQRFQADPAGTGAWTGFSPAGLTLRRNHGAATVIRVVSSRVLVVGGQDAAGTVLQSVEEYQAQAVTLVNTPHTDLPAARARFGIASTRTSNQVYVMGGVDSAGTDQATVFELTAATNGATAGPPGTPSGDWVTRGSLSVARSGLQVSTPPAVTNFLTVQSGGRDQRQDAIDVWVALAVRSSRAPVSATDAAAVRGRTAFGEVGLVQPGFSCATCHGGPKWTRSTVDYVAPPSPEVGLGLGNERVIGAELRQTLTQGTNVLSNVGTFTLAGRENEIRVSAADPGQAINPLGANGFNIPSLLSVHETAPYFYSGLAQTLSEVLDGSQDGNGGVRHHFVADAAERADLVQFLQTIDGTTPAFP